MNNIQVTKVLPPIPCSSFDFYATFGEEGDSFSPHGWGRTAEEAIEDLLENSDTEE